MAHSWSKGVRTRAKTRYRTYDPTSHQMLQNKAIINQQLQSQKNVMFQLAEQVAEIMEKNNSDKFLKQLQNKKNKIIAENKKKANQLAKDIRGLGDYVKNPLKLAITSSREKARKMYESRGTTTDKNIATKSHVLYAGAEAANIALNYATQAAKFAYNRYITLQEDYMTGQTVTNVQNTISRVKNAGTSILSGIATGASIGGGWGAAIGGVASAIDFGVTQYFEYQTRISNYYQQLNATNYQTNFSSSRASLIGSSGTEN